MQNSVIRRGNHFIRTRAYNWLLIDGPWRKYLEALAGPQGWRVRIAPFMAPSYAPIESGDLYKYQMPLPLEWDLVFFTWIYSPPFQYRWALRRQVTGWRLEPSGVLPAYLHRVEEIDDPRESARQIQNGY